MGAVSRWSLPVGPYLTVEHAANGQIVLSDSRCIRERKTILWLTEDEAQRLSDALAAACRHVVDDGSLTGTVPTRVYIAGPMTGIPDHNYPAFRAAAFALRSAGLDPVNPADHADGGEHPWGWWMRRALTTLVTCDAVAMLPGWRHSTGALIEARVAGDLGMEVKPLREWVVGSA